MANVNGSSRHSLLPPKCPFPSIPPTFAGYVPGHMLGPKSFPNPRNRNSHHIRNASESFLIEEQPSWLDELLNEPETPVSKGSHRRASSDSFALQDNFRHNNMVSVPSWGSLDLDSQDSRAASERKDFSDAMSCSSEANAKRAKQQFAQRSRVRKLQYIAELERTVQVLQAEGCEVTAQLKFINQQNLILSMENKALKQRLDSLAQEHLIKHLEHEVLEREIGRLQVLFQQQQLPPPPSSLRRTSSRDLDSQFSNLSLKHKDSSSVHNSISGPLQS